jgi:hypothetical protein
MIGIPKDFEPRRRKELEQELLSRAHVWLPEWRPRQGADDFATALFEIVARLESEVTQRLDKIPQKVFRGFLYWLGVGGRPARAGRLPVVFKMAEGADPVLARAPIQLQATPTQTDTSQPADPVTFETEDDLMVSRGSLASLVGAKPLEDKFVLPPNGYFTIEPPKAGPTEWHLTSEAPQNAKQLQLEPELGLDALPTLLHVKTQKQYRVTKVEGSLVTIEPPLEALASDGDIFERSDLFDPFGAPERNRQEHVLYIGSESALNLPTRANITVQALDASAREARWFYWGKKGTEEGLDWQAFEPRTGTELTLTKTAGSVEMLTLDGKPSRWLRAVRTPDAQLETSQVSQIQLVVNCPPLDEDEPSSVAVEAIANTTPLVLDTPFFPLGREPKLFDAFYIGSAEAFSKKNASVSIRLQALDATAESWSAAKPNATAAGLVLFSVGEDHQLHRLSQDAINSPIVRATTVRPPFNESGVPTVNAAPGRLDPPMRVATVTQRDRVVVGLTENAETWLWAQQQTTPGASRWHQLRAIQISPGDPSDTETPPAVVVLSDGDGLQVIRLYAGTLWELALTPGWENRDVPKWRRYKPVAPDKLWKSIAPVFNPGTRLSGATFGDGWLAVDAAGVLYFFARRGPGESVLRREHDEIGAVSTDAAPLAILDANAPADRRLTLIAKKTKTEIAAWRIPYDQAATGSRRNPIVADGVLLGRSFDWIASSGSDIAIVLAGKFPPRETALAAWFPFEPNVDAADRARPYLSQELPGLRGAAAVAAGVAVAPARDGDVLVVPLDVNARPIVDVPPERLASSLLVEPGRTFEKDDFIKVKLKSKSTIVAIVRQDDLHTNPDAGTWVEVPDSEMAVPASSPAAYHRTTRTRTGSVKDHPTKTSTTILGAAGDDHTPTVGDTIIVSRSNKLSIHTIAKFERSANDPPLITVKPKIRHAPTGSDVDYTYVTELTASIHPLVDSKGLVPDIAPALRSAGAFFRGAVPFPNRLLFLEPPTAAHSFAVLRDNWHTIPSKNLIFHFTLTASQIFGELTTIADPKTSNPALSWEYFDGSAWWTIKRLEDGTSNLRSTGLITFCVPEGLQATDVAGRTNHWIRARLVGGDFGQETVIVKSKQDETDPKTTVQTVSRSQSGINPPQYSSIDLRYSVCCPVFPDYVITADGGRLRDQTEANKLEDAQVEMFVPLTETIRRTIAPDVAAGTRFASEPALYLGFDDKLEGGPINVLFLVEEARHDAAAVSTADADADRDSAFPLQVDVLREHGFEAVIADDGTRGLNESGVLSFTVSAAAPQLALFGPDERYWIRLRPSAKFKGDWRPRIRSAFLNGAWALAEETEVLARLGSSDGSPKQRVFLARPPVLEGSLELRVREPIGDEDVKALREVRPDAVNDKLENDQPGPWVLWALVDDPDDEEKDARVYSLDHETGAILFGDGEHGRIPPIGRDNIVAVTYKRGGGDAANKVSAWSQINLVSPVPGVETVVAPEGAAGGSDPQKPEEIVRFAPANRLMRDRALTLRDLEMLAMQFSPDIAQVRAFRRSRDIQLVVVMRGRDLQPPEQVRRELGRFLALKTTPMLAAHGAIDIAGPVEVQTYIDLQLAIDRVDSSGSVADEATTLIRRLFDPATGGLDASGWRLGDAPSASDVAAVLDGIKHLDEIRAVRVVNLDALTAMRTLGPKELATLTPEGIGFQLELSDLEVPA